MSTKKKDEQNATDAAIAYLRSQGLGDIAYTGDSVEQPATTPEVKPVGEAPDTVNAGVSVEQPATTPQPTDYETEMDNLSKDYTNAVGEGQKNFQDYVLGIAERNRQAEAEMLQQEKVDRMAGTATGLTELAANVANLLSVGQLHATPQQYHSFSQDWMKKADMDARERRHRRDNMQAQMDRLNYQIEQVKTANRLGDIKLKMDLAQQKEAARVAAEKEAQERQRKEQEKKAAQDANMLKSGFVPDENDPSGYRFDPNLASQIAGAKRATSATGRQAYSAYRTTTQPAGGATTTTAPTAAPATGSAVSTQGGAKSTYTASGNAQSAAAKPTQTGGGSKKRGGRTTFLPPEEDVWEKDRDKKNSPQSRKKIAPETEETNDWSKYKVK